MWFEGIPIVTQRTAKIVRHLLEKTDRQFCEDVYSLIESDPVLNFSYIKPLDCVQREQWNAGRANFVTVGIMMTAFYYQQIDDSVEKSEHDQFERRSLDFYLVMDIRDRLKPYSIDAEISEGLLMQENPYLYNLLRSTARSYAGRKSEIAKDAEDEALLHCIWINEAYRTLHLANTSVR